MEAIILREMAWERAKGEMQSMLVTYVGDTEGYNNLEELIDKAIDSIEGNF